MSLKVVWSEFSEIQLNEIYEYYKNKASISIAKKLIKEIIKEADTLINAPEIGEKEEFLKHREIEYRYLLFKNYKLIYSIDFKEELIKIADVFDTRQNPIKLKRTK